jgi:hypothetical protein
LLIGELGTYTETIYAEPFLGSYMLLDILVNFTTGFSAYLNGVNLTPLFTGSALTSFGGDATLTLLNNTARSDAAVGAELVFAGIAAGTITQEQHQADAHACEVREDGLSIDEVTTWEWAWSPDRLETETLPGMPLYGATDAALTVTGTFEEDQLTNIVRPEGLARERLDRGLLPGATTDQLRRTPPTTFPAVDDDAHIRAIFKLEAGTAATQRVVFFERSGASLGLEVNSSGDVVAYAMSGYSQTVAGAITLGEWNLLDFVLDRDGGGGGEALINLFLNGSQLSTSAHTGTISDLAAGAGAALFGDQDNSLGAADGVTLAFAGIELGSASVSLARHQLDAAALGVVP